MSTPNPFNFSSSYWSTSSSFSSDTDEDHPLAISSADEAKLRMRGYQIGAFIGEGDYGSVHYAQRGEVTCAVKSIKIKSHKIKIPRELSFIKKIQHPNVVQLFDCYLTKDGKGRDMMLFFMELVEGGNLSELLKKKKTHLTEEQARSYYLQFGDALRFMHRLGIAHLDLILTNIVLDRTQQICKVTDFGLTRVIYESHDGQLRTSAINSQEYNYMAPEVLHNDIFDEATEYRLLPLDVWSSGIVLFRLLNNRFPFIRYHSDKDLEEIYDAQMDWKYKFHNRTLSRDARRMIYDLLEPDPEQRPTFEDIMVNQPWLKNGTGRANEDNKL